MWALLYRDGSTRRYATLGSCSEMSKSAAEKKRDEILARIRKLETDAMKNATNLDERMAAWEKTVAEPPKNSSSPLSIRA